MIEVEKVFFLHRRPYRESRQIVTALLENRGRVNFFMSKNRSKKYDQVSLFEQGNLYFLEKELSLSLRGYEVSRSFTLKGKSLLAGFYLNEILYKAEDGANLSDLYPLYVNTIEKLSLIDKIDSLKMAVSFFEYFYLKIVGYAIDFSVESFSNKSVVANKFYVFFPMEGFREATDLDPENSLISGEILLTIDQFPNEMTREVSQVFRQIVRQSIIRYFIKKPLKSLELYS